MMTSAMTSKRPLEASTTSVKKLKTKHVVDPRRTKPRRVPLIAQGPVTGEVLPDMNEIFKAVLNRQDHTQHHGTCTPPDTDKETPDADSETSMAVETILDMMIDKPSTVLGTVEHVSTTSAPSQGHQLTSAEAEAYMQSRIKQLEDDDPRLTPAEAEAYIRSRIMEEQDMQNMEGEKPMTSSDAVEKLQSPPLQIVEKSKAGLEIRGKAFSIF